MFHNDIYQEKKISCNFFLENTLIRTSFEIDYKKRHQSVAKIYN